MSSELSLTIHTIGAGGDGIATLQDKNVYIPKTAPGDTARIRLESENADGIQGRLAAIEIASPERVTPPCPYFDRCGGCSLQHVKEEFYRNWKLEKVLQPLQRAGIKIGQIDEPVFLAAATRRRTTMTALKNGVLGYNEYRSHNIVDAKRCLILEPALDLKMQSLRPYLPRLITGKNPIDVMMQQAGGEYDLVFTGLKPPFSLEQLEAMAELAEALDIARISTRPKDFAPLEIAFTRKPCIKQFGVVHVKLPPAAFLQASAEGEETLVRIVMDYACGAQYVADLFSGCGTFTGHLLQQGMSVHAMDGDADAIEALSAVKHPKLSTSRRNLFKEPLRAKELAGFDTVVFDPPRAGAKAQCEQLDSSAVKRIIAVSCNPATFVRDARTLQDGGYSLERLTLVDQFVWSAHAEIVALFKA